MSDVPFDFSPFWLPPRLRKNPTGPLTPIWDKKS